LEAKKYKTTEGKNQEPRAKNQDGKSQEKRIKNQHEGANPVESINDNLRLPVFYLDS